MLCEDKPIGDCLHSCFGINRWRDEFHADKTTVDFTVI